MNLEFIGEHIADTETLKNEILNKEYISRAKMWPATNFKSPQPYHYYTYDDWQECRPRDEIQTCVRPANLHRPVVNCQTVGQTKAIANQRSSLGSVHVGSFDLRRFAVPVSPEHKSTHVTRGIFMSPTVISNTPEIDSMTYQMETCFWEIRTPVICL